MITEFFSDLPELDLAVHPAAERLQILLESVDMTLFGKYEVDDATGLISA